MTKKKVKVHLCKECKNFINTKIIRCCVCGEFCSKRCQDFYHGDIENYSRRELKFTYDKKFKTHGFEIRLDKGITVANGFRTRKDMIKSLFKELENE